MKEKAFGKSDGGSDLNFSGKTWDVKTKLRNIPYLWAEYGHNVDDAQAKNTCDGYIFCSYSTPTMVMSICGWLPKFVFEKLAVAHKKDEIKKLPSGREFRFTKDCHEVANHQLFKPELLIKAAENFNRK